MRRFNDYKETIKRNVESRQLVPKNKDEIIASTKLYVENALELESRYDDCNHKQFQALRNNYLQDELDTYKNPFPVEVFPKIIQEYIHDLYISCNAPKEYTSAGILTALAGAIGNKFHVQLKDGLLMAPMLYMVLIGKTGSNKSTPLRMALAPLYWKEKEYSKSYEKDLKLFLKAKADKKEIVKEPVEKRCIVNDVTMECLVDILESNDVTVYCDEFQGFLNSMNKYRAGDDMEKWLSIFGSQPLRSDRKGKRGKLIPVPFANCVGTIQPEVLNIALSKSTSNGFYERLLFVTTPNDFKTEWNFNQPNRNLSESYQAIIKNILNIPRRVDLDGLVNPVVVNFSPQACSAIIEWQRFNDGLCKSTADNQLEGTYRKLESYTIRFSLIMCILTFAEKGTKLLTNENIQLRITEKNVKSAIRITEYFRNSAKSITTLNPSIISPRNVNKRVLGFFDGLPDSFSLSQAMEVGEQLKLSKRTVYNYLKHTFFRSVDRGFYEKTYEYS